ncbi:hypothetical protein O0L34_g12459 [Tuta absoluta]|nr:hypothetical protein O0L34_g12459 [Tuta absoluta]
MGQVKNVQQNGTAKDKVRKMPSEKSVPNWFSRVSFCWMFPIFYWGNKRDLDEFDLQPAKKIFNSKETGDELERCWLLEEAAAKAAGRKPSYTKVLIRTFGWSFIPAGIIQFMSITLRTVSPLLFAQLLSYWSVDSTIDRITATYYGLGMIACNWFAAFFSHHGNLLAQQYGMKLRVASSTLMFRKIMRLNNNSLGDTAAGKVVNILSNDMQRFDLAFLFMHYTWIIPLQLIAVCYLGYYQAGYAALVGFAALIIIALPIQGVMGRLLGLVRFRTADKTDDRIKVMSEVISGIQVIKMYAWEIPFQKVVKAKRDAEMKWIKTATWLRTIFIGFLLFSERTALFIAILTYVLLGNAMSANTIYPLQQFMSAAQVNITVILPLVISFTSELIVSLGRIQKFLDLEDRPDLLTRSNTQATGNLFGNMTSDIVVNSENKKGVRPLSYQPKFETAITPISNGVQPRHSLNRSMSHANETAVELRGVTASWTNDPNFCALKNVSLRVRKGKLCAVIGAVGSGKSSLLQLLLKELPALSGQVSVDGSVSYACQEPWLFPSTVRENILFGLPYDADKYRRVCRVCALEKDFKQFPFGDQTLVGERGVSMSGGQRARVNLARAVYREADIYLLDDPLSAVDANVGRQLFEGCINGYMRGRTRILVTHQIHFLKAADYIIVMNEGGIENMGTFDQLISTGKEFATMLNALGEGKEKDTESNSSGTSNDPKKMNRMLSTVSTTGETGEKLEEFEAQKVTAEERSSGNLKWAVVSGYFRSGGSWCFVFFVVFMILLAAISAGAVDYWISYWANEMARYEASLPEGQTIDPALDTQVGAFTTAQYLIIHSVLVLLTIILTQVRNVPFVKLCTSASKNLHNTMFSNMIKGIMRFFDTSSSGRILNRFTKDMGALDEILPRSLLDVFQIYSTLLLIIVLNAISLYLTLILSIVLLVIFALFVKVYMKTAQGIKRLEGTTKSPVFGMVTSSLNGISTIRSCKAEDRLVSDFDVHQDLHTAAWNGYLCGGSTFSLYLDTICVTYLALVIFVFLYVDFGDAIAVGSVGLAVTQSNTLTNMLQHGARMLVEFVAQLTSVERVLEYTKIESEPNLYEGQVPTPPTWPLNGRIVFKDVNMRYAPDLEPVLKNLNLVIESGWKVGIVGRTGAGKSSLISAMFRFAYIDGRITIDGLDTGLVSLQSLRSKISIIPQEPVLFSASMRYNLDPFDIYSDDDLWRALEQVDMKSAVPSLDFKVTEGGSNFSVGQRQLLCLARALLRSNKILIMDEATANVDPSTDNFIQQTIRRQFASCTVLTIAHRLNTIMDSDRVLVMSFGQVAEFDHPHHLLLDPDSAFSAMVRETGEKNARVLAQAAKDAYFASHKHEQEGRSE